MAFQPALVTEYENTNALYELMRETEGQIFIVDTLGSYTTEGESTSLKYWHGADIQTGPDTALEVLGFGFKMVAYQDFSNVSTSAGSDYDEFDVTVSMMYTQPQPPATDSTTLASTSGNLGFRNRFWETMIVGVPATQNLGGASTGLVGYMGQIVREGTVILRRPIRIVGSKLALAYSTSSSNDGVTFAGRWQVVARPVHINSHEYVNLVALATGQAILPPSILG
jgi:hypothetical protein